MIGAAVVTGVAVLATVLLLTGDDQAGDQGEQAGPPVTAGPPGPPGSAPPGGSPEPAVSRSQAAPPASQDPARPGPGFVPAYTLGSQVRFDFSARESARGGDAGRAGLTLAEAGSSGGRLVPERRGDGWAIHFPRHCPETEHACPRAILETGRVGWLNPGSRPVRWGATVRMAPDEVSKGSNVVQKGFSLAGTQFKLQVDGMEGQPSCVMAGQVNGADRIFMARARTGVADGLWHSLGCERRSGSLSVTVDGVKSAHVAVPEELSIENPEPLRIGGKGPGADNDQFHGAVDDVYVNIG